MICNCSMVGTMACKTCQRYKEYIAEEKSPTQLAKEKEQANYEAWQSLSKLREIAERQKQREIDEMVKQGGDRELIEYIYDRLIEKLCFEIDRKLIGGTEDDTV